MSDRLLNLVSPPIVEAVLDIECDMPPMFDLPALEGAAGDLFRDRYPKLRQQYMQALRVEGIADGMPNVTARQGIQAFQFRQDDEKQLVQVRAQGFSFNRLAPYSGLDTYMSEIERTWHLFAELVSPVQVRLVRLRYINRVLLPLVDGRVVLDEYLTVGLRLPDEERLTFIGFLNQHSMVEADTGNQVNVALTTQSPEEGRLPLIFEIEVVSTGNADPGDWPWIGSRIHSLRALKNRIFANTLTDKCLNLFRH